MVLDPVRKFSQRYSRCSMENVLQTWTYTLQTGVLETDDPLLKTEEEPRNRLDVKAELPQNVRLDLMNHFQRTTS